MDTAMEPERCVPTAEQAWQQTAALVVSLGNAHYDCYGGDYDDILSEAQLLFLQALESFRPEVAKLTTWIAIKVRNGLKDYQKSKQRRLKRERRIYRDSEHNRPLRRAKRQVTVNFALERLLFELSTDAATVVKMAMYSRKKLSREVKQSIRRHLRDLGWKCWRIEKVFNELQNAI